ncbi:MAG: hypothetical protein LBR72_04670, partial [Oscillospiraceae bacterium]|nr:hypothetical protein [Oscillospiraceae bacterium]
MKKLSRVLSLALLLTLLLSITPRLTVSAVVSNTDLPASPEAESFVSGEVLVAAESEDEALRIANAYSLTLKSYAYGIAVLAAPDPEAAVKQSAQLAPPYGGMALPKLGLNMLYRTADVTETEPPE